ncbi:DUF222 domain-containing protein [Ruania alkalisoli]|uniref:DUF222 domain-containing protein n=1 Tax=Ruania alkalisoli TaxID=2779775 RepID=A0A7M1SR57_9MICO|nr:DUF222 domain-containing protein [Ruania alkalisoli]QOR69617.1 DUF222 domain-containing protein [Ruania alkalisoli]
MTSTAAHDTFSVSAGKGLLAAVRATGVAARAVEVERAELVLAWVREGAIIPGEVDPDDVVDGGGVFDPDEHAGLPGTQEPMRLAGAGAPRVPDLGFVSLAAALGMSNEAALGYVGAVVELAYRLPVLWGRVRAGQVSITRARAVTRLTKRLPADGAAWVDSQVAWTIGSCSLGQIERTVTAAMESFDPERAERDRLAELERRRFDIHQDEVSTARGCGGGGRGPARARRCVQPGGRGESGSPGTDPDDARHERGCPPFPRRRRPRPRPDAPPPARHQ